ncbi:MAG: hypothetical protein AB7S66_08425 [Sphaerochaeta sp.]|uniref:hypothetical protein n=1 Tax=Sphaerochaeta sp. TaxID=1972642 RepID=UPI003D0C2072
MEFLMFLNPLARFLMMRIVALNPSLVALVLNGVPCGACYDLAHPHDRGVCEFAGQLFKRIGLVGVSGCHLHLPRPAVLLLEMGKKAQHGILVFPFCKADP